MTSASWKSDHLDGLSHRIKNCLLNGYWYEDKNNHGGFPPIEWIANQTPQNLLKIPNFGKKCLEELSIWLADRGYHLEPLGDRRRDRLQRVLERLKIDVDPDVILKEFNRDGLVVIQR